MVASDHGDVEHRVLACVPEAAALARAALDRWAPVLEAAVFDHARLLISELVTGCVTRGGAAEAEPVVLALRLEDDALRVEITHPSAALDGGDGERDRGWTLYLLGALATRWGMRHHGASRTVWFELERA